MKGDRAREEERKKERQKTGGRFHDPSINYHRVKSINL